MADPKEPLQFADEHIKEVEQKLASNNHGKESAQEIFARINGIPTPAPEKPIEVPSNPLAVTPPPAEPQTPQSQVVIKNLRTFQGDVAEAMKKQGTSVLSIALAEKKREQDNQKKIAEAGLQKTSIIPPTEIQKSGSLKSTLPPERPIQSVISEPVVVPVNHEARNRIIIITSSIIFILLGIGAVGAFYVFQKNAPTPITTEPAENKSIVAYNKASAVAVDTATQDELFETLNRQRREKVLGDNETLYISLVTTATDNSLVPISPARFFKIFENSAPASLIRAFGSKMMFGLYKTTQNEPFLLIRVDSFDNAFTGMLEWEAGINKDIGILFSKNLLPVTEVAPGVGQSAGTTTIQKTLNVDLANDTSFEDETIKNKDIRILRNKQGDTILLYSFIDKNTLLITASIEVLQAMVNKVADQKLVR